MWTGWVEWREKLRPFEITFDEVKEEYYFGKVFVLGRDKSGNICLYFKARRHHPSETTPQKTLKLIYYILEKLEDRTINEGRF